jgi:hypothetical protein
LLRRAAHQLTIYQGRWRPASWEAAEKFRRRELFLTFDFALLNEGYQTFFNGNS